MPSLCCVECSLYWQEFLVPLREQETLISFENLRLVFSNIELLANLNKTLLKRLEERVEQWEAHTPLSDVFAEMVRSFLDHAF